MRIGRRKLASLKRKAKVGLRNVILDLGPSVLPLVPGKKRRARFSKAMVHRKGGHEELAKWAAEQPRGSLSLKATLKYARSARIAQNPELSSELIEARYEKTKTSSALLVQLARDRIKSGDMQDALEFVKRAIILYPRYVAATKTYLTIRRELGGDPELDRALLKIHKTDMSIVWGFCKQCRTDDDLALLQDVLQQNDVLPQKYIRPFSNAALRAERFDLGRAQFIRAIQAAAEHPPKKATAAKSIGAGGPEALVDIVKLLDEANVPHFAAAGTCLGMVREGRPLAHDNDIDIGIMEEHWQPERLSKLISDSPLFKFDQPHPKSPKIGAIHHTGATIDLFRFYEENGLIWHNGVFVRWGNAPFEFETRDLDGTAITIPAGADYLVENYGDWETPDPLFDAFLNGPNREVIWPEYYAAHMLRTINLTIRRGKIDKAIGFINDGIACEYLTRQEKDQLAVVVRRLEGVQRVREAKRVEADAQD